jgi:putative CocE/NonD family hydrolase
MPVDTVSFGTPVRRHVLIPMPDGARLAADLFLPSAGALGDGRRYPVVFDYYPYRKDDGLARLTRAHRRLAARGFVAARIDVRGSGSSTGTAADEYCEQELADGVEAIAWLAAQPWSNGNVGMFGSSYGGFNSLQVAMRRPPALKAIVPMYFTDNRYTDDCHYKGGSLQMMFDIGTYGLSMVAMNALPPSREALGPDWAAAWDDHLAAEPWLMAWLEHQTWDPYWQHGSLCTSYESVQAAAYLIGGWRDGYANCILRTFAALRGPKKAIVGPWGHTWADVGVPGPQVDFLAEVIRFFEHWLAGADNGVMDEPPLSIYVRRYDPPDARRTMQGGMWRHEAEWPLARGVESVLHFVPDGALRADASADTDEVVLPYNPTVGTTFGLFGGSSAVLVQPGDQRLEDAWSLSWTSPPVEAATEILGSGSVALRVSATASVATVVARLIDVAPDGAAALVTKGVLNLTHRSSHAEPTPIEPGRWYDVDVFLESTSWTFEPGHAIRVALTGADYPLLWPSPFPYDLHVAVGGDAPSRLMLPVVPPTDAPLPAPALAPSAPTTELPGFALEPASWRVTRDLTRGTVEVELATNNGTRLADGTLYHPRGHATTSVNESNPADASIVGTSSLALESATGTVEARARGEIRSDAATLHVTVNLDVLVDGATFHSRRWSRSVPRRLL